MARRDQANDVDLPAVDGEVAIGLTPPQAKAIDLILMGCRDAVVAEQVGVRRQTVNQWRNQHPAFRAVLQERRREMWDVTQQRLLRALPSAVDALTKAVEGYSSVSAAVALLRMAGFPQQRGIVEAAIDGAARCPTCARPIAGPLTHPPAACNNEGSASK